MSRFLLPDVFVQCDVCKGKRYNRETLNVTFKEKSIADVLDMSVDEGVRFFENIPIIKDKLLTLQKVGLGYIKIGQQATTLSGGEAQRIKLAKELSKRSTGRTIYILDEPTTGLHAHDIKKLLEVLQAFVQKGNTVLVIEHNMDVIKTADWLIDMGPEGGVNGGQILFQGKPEDIAKVKNSYTAQYLDKILKIKNNKLDLNNMSTLVDNFYELLLARGLYEMQLTPWYNSFPQNKILITSSEELSNNTNLLISEFKKMADKLLSEINFHSPNDIKKEYSIPLNEMIKNSSTNLLRVIHYPPLNDNIDPSAIRAGAHEDINLITLLVAGSEPGLQVLSQDGKWVDVSTSSDYIVVNIGDMLQECSGGYFPSTTHRVVNPSDKNMSRYSMPFFVHARDEVMLSKKYTAKSYLEERLKEIGLK